MAGRWFQWTLIALAAILAVLVGLLARENAALKRQLAARPPVELAPGDVLGPITLAEPDGGPRPLELHGPTLLLVFSAECPACREVMPFWEGLPDRISGGGPKIVGLQLGVAEPSVVVPYPVHAVDSARSPGLDRVPFVPATILLAGDGTIRKAWIGPLGRDEQTDLIAHLGG